MAFLKNIFGCDNNGDSSGDEAFDDDSKKLSPIGTAAYDVLRKKHNHHHHECWNVTSGKVQGSFLQTPFGRWQDSQDPPVNHDNWLAANMCALMSKATKFVDVTSLGPPDGEFMVQFKKALGVIAATAEKQGGEPIPIRMLFGNIIGMPVDCDTVIKDLTADLPEDANIELWVGAWRTGVSWNHSKIIAVDGKYLHNGGHNLWDAHYLKNNPVHDVSMQCEGRVAHDGHLYANKMWKFIKHTQKSFIGRIINHFPDTMPTVFQSRVTVSEYPEEYAEEFPPQYVKKQHGYHWKAPLDGEVPMITMGRFGALSYINRPSDDAFIAMFDTAKTSIRASLQDIGPICLPLQGAGIVTAVPGCCWPDRLLKCWAKAIYQRGVDVELALSNPGSIPGGLTPTQALYGNGWTCANVASEIISRIRDMGDENGEEIDNDQLVKMVKENLRITYIKQAKSNHWQDQGTLGNHAKHFIIDDCCYYVGSQNLYMCDLAEWGILIDDKEQTKKVMEEYWTPMWQNSYSEADCDVDEVMEGLDIDRNGADIKSATPEQLALAHQMANKNPGHDAHHLEDEDELARHS